MVVRMIGLVIGVLKFFLCEELVIRVLEGF
jgi:hypothetical protein